MGRLKTVSLVWQPLAYRLRSLSRPSVLPWLYASLCIAATLLLLIAQARLESNLTKQDVKTAIGSIEPAEDSRPEFIQKKRLEAFDSRLTEYESIPLWLGALLDDAKQRSLVISQAEYRQELDNEGRFLRLRVMLQIKGSAPLVHRLVADALEANRALALGNMTFKRDKGSSNTIEANVQLIAFTRLPKPKPEQNLSSEPPHSDQGGRL